MNNYEILTIGAAVLALIISVKSMFTSRNIAQKQLELQRSTSALAEKQLEMLLAEESSKNSASLSFQAKTRDKKHKFVVRNTSQVVAKNVSFELFPQGRGESPLVGSDFSSKFPIPALAPGSAVGVLAALHLGSATAFEVKLCWEDPNGKQREESTFVSF